MTESGTDARKPQIGSQTLARGLRALVAVADAADGMTVQALAAELDVHRSIAYRILQTLAEFGFVTHSPDGAYRAGSRLAALSNAYLPALRETSLPIMRGLADKIGCTVALFVVEGGEAVSIELVEPMTVTHHLAFRAGMRTPLDRGAAGYALLAAGPARADEPPAVTAARKVGYASSAGEVEAGAHAVAAPIPGSHPAACLNLMSYREDQVIAAREHIVRAAHEVSELSARRS